MSYPTPDIKQAVWVYDEVLVYKDDFESMPEGYLKEVFGDLWEHVIVKTAEDVPSEMMSVALTPAGRMIYSKQAEDLAEFKTWSESIGWDTERWAEREERETEHLSCMWCATKCKNQEELEAHESECV